VLALASKHAFSKANFFKDLSNCDIKVISMAYAFPEMGFE